MPSEESELSSDRLFELISNARRRFVLSRVSRGDGPVELSVLAEELAAWENDTTVERLPAQARKSVYVSLYQTHVPKLDDAGLVEYDVDSGTVSLSEDADVLDRHLAPSTDRPRWYVYYTALAAANGALIAAVVGGLVALSQMAVGAIVTASFLVAVTSHAVYRVVLTDGERPSLVNHSEQPRE